MDEWKNDQPTRQRLSANQKTIVTVLQSKKIKPLQESEPVEQDSLFDQVKRFSCRNSSGTCLKRNTELNCFCSSSFSEVQNPSKGLGESLSSSQHKSIDLNFSLICSERPSLPLFGFLSTLRIASSPSR